MDLGETGWERDKGHLEKRIGDLHILKSCYESMCIYGWQWWWCVCGYFPRWKRPNIFIFNIQVEM